MRNGRFVSTLMSGLLACLAGCGGSGSPISGGKASPEDLGRAVLEALSKKDKTAFISLYATADAVMVSCPEMSGKRDKLMKRMTQTLEAAASSFDACLAFDWSRAKPVSADGGDSRGVDDKCESLTTLRDYVVEADIDGQRVELKLEDPLKLGTSHFLDDKLECRLVSAASVPVPAGAEAPPKSEAAVPAVALPAVAQPALPAVAGDPGPVCNQFVTAYQACVSLLNEAARPPLLQALEAMKKSWLEIADQGTRDVSCLQSRESMKAGLGALCPGLFD